MSHRRVTRAVSRFLSVCSFQNHLKIHCKQRLWDDNGELFGTYSVGSDAEHWPIFFFWIVYFSHGCVLRTAVQNDARIVNRETAIKISIRDIFSSWITRSSFFLQESKLEKKFSVGIVPKLKIRRSISHNSVANYTLICQKVRVISKWSWKSNIRVSFYKKKVTFFHFVQVEEKMSRVEIECWIRIRPWNWLAQ